MHTDHGLVSAERGLVTRIANAVDRLIGSHTPETVEGLEIAQEDLTWFRRAKITVLVPGRVYSIGLSDVVDAETRDEVYRLFEADDLDEMFDLLGSYCPWAAVGCFDADGTEERDADELANWAAMAEDADCPMLMIVGDRRVAEKRCA